MLRVEIERPDGQLKFREIELDGSDSADAVKHLLETEKVITVHSAEATLEDIFIQITGRGLTG
jgi:ABC-2 type transport system ATP-binding protein